MKQGSADDPFADDSGSEERPDEPPVADSTTQSEPGDAADSTPTDSTATAAQRARSLPYIHARDGVKDGRKQRPVFLREHIETGIDDLVARMEAEFGEDVYKTDVTEAAMAVAEDNPELVREKLDEWGYGWA